MRKTSIKKIMDGVRGSNGGPFTIIAFDGKLLEQRSRPYPQEIPLEVEAMRKEFPNAKIEVEDKGGHIIYQSTPTRERSFAKGGEVDLHSGGYDVDKILKIIRVDSIDSELGASYVEDFVELGAFTWDKKKINRYFDEQVDMVKEFDYGEGQEAQEEKEGELRELEQERKDALALDFEDDFFLDEKIGIGRDDDALDFVNRFFKINEKRLVEVAPQVFKKYDDMFAKGGVLDKEFKFDKNFVIYVPSTSNVGDKISSSEMGERVSEVEELVANEFGGFTKTETDGGYKASSGDIVEEDIVKVSVFSTDEAWEKNEKRLIRAIKIWAKEWGQEAIGFEYEGDLYYIDAKGKMAHGGKTMTPSDIVSLLTDEEVAKELVDKMFETLESVDFDVDEKTALTQAKDNIEHSRKMLIEILEHQA